MRKWFVTQGIKGSYVVEYTSSTQPFKIWIKGLHNYWELVLVGVPSGLRVLYKYPDNRVFFETDSYIPAKDLNELYKGVRQGWHKQPPPDYFSVIFPTN